MPFLTRLRYQWRFAVLGILGAVALIVAIVFTVIASPTEVSLESLPFLPPIDVYVNDPDAKVAVIVDINPVFNTPGSRRSPNEWVYLQVAPPTPQALVDWMVVMDTKTTQGGPGSSQLPLFSGFDTTTPQRRQTVITGSTYEMQHPTGPQSPKPPWAAGQLVAAAFVPEPYEFVGSRFYAQLPLVISNPSAIEFGPAVELQTDKSNLQRQILTTSGPTSDTLGHFTFPEILRNSWHEDFYVPRTLSATERLEVELPDRLKEYRTDTTFPATVGLDNGSLVWQGGAGLQASMIATNVPAEESRSVYAFIAGIAWASAAAAFIAVLQERPRDQTLGAAKLRSRQSSL